MGILPRKSIAIFLGVVYFTTQVALGSVAESNVWAERQKAFKQAERQLPLFHLTSLGSALPVSLKENLPKETSSKLEDLFSSLPQTYGTIRAVSLPSKQKSDKVIFHIQDVHGNSEAQANIGKTVQELINRKIIDLVALEGAFQPIDVKPFRTFPHPGTVQKVADCLLRENEISGPIHTALVSPVEIPPVVGIDDRESYAANVEAYRRSTTLVRSYKERLATLDRRLSERKSNTFNSELAAFDAYVQAYRKGEIKMGDYVEALAKHDSRVTPAVKTFREALRLETSLNSSQVEAERARLLSALIAKLSVSQSQALVNASIAYRVGNLRAANFYVYLRNLCEKKNLQFSRYPAMNSYLQYVLLSDSIDAGQLLEEIDTMEEAAYASLGRTEREKELVSESRELFLIGKLLDFSLTKEEWGEYKAMGHAKDNQLNLQTFEGFYQEAEVRDRFMTENLLRAMDKANAKVAVLVTGGFHSSGIEKRISGAGIASITFVPKITKVETENGSVYLSVFAQEKSPLEKLFEGEKLFLADSPMNYVATIGGVIGMHRLDYPFEGQTGILHEEKFARSVGIENFGIEGKGENTAEVALSARNASAKIWVGRNINDISIKVQSAKSYFGRFSERKDEILYPWLQEKWNILSWSYAVPGHFPQNDSEWRQLAGNYVSIWVFILSFGAVPASFFAGFENPVFFGLHFLFWLLPAIFIGVFPAHFVTSVAAVALGIRSPTKPAEPPIDHESLLGEIPGADAAILFGAGLNRWIGTHMAGNGKTAVRIQAAKEIAGDNSPFWTKLNQLGGDAGLAVIQYAVENDIDLGTKSLQLFTNEMKKQASSHRKKDIKTIQLSILDFVRLRLTLETPDVSHFLVSAEFKELDAEDKLAAVVTQIKDKKLPLESDNLGQIYSALPARLPGGVLKRDIQTVSLPMRVFDQVRAGLDAIKEFLVSSEFKELDAEDKLAAVVTQIKDKKLPLESDNLGQIYSALPARLPGGVLKRDIQTVSLPMRVFDQVRAGLDAIKEFLVSSEFKELDAEDKLAAVVTQIKDKKLPLESDNLGHIYSALPARLPGGVLKRDIQTVSLPMRVFDQVRAGLDAIKEFLVSSEFKELDAEDKLAAVVTQIKDKKLPLESDNLGQIYSALPARLPGGVLKRDIQKVELPMRVFDQVRAGLDAIKEFLVSSEFKELDAEDKLAAVVTQIKDKKLPLESDNLGHIYSALPARLPGGVLKRDIQTVSLPMRVFDQVRAGLDAIKEFLVSSEFKELDAEDKLAAVVTQIKDKKLPLESDNLGQIYSALPARLPGGVLKRDIQKVELPMRVFDQVRAGLDAIKEFLVSSEFKELDAEDKLAAVVTQIKDKKLPLESDNLGHIYSALPARLPGGVLKRDIQTVSLPMRVFDQVRAGLDAIKEFLVSSEFKELDAEDKLAAVVTQIKDKKLPLESDNLGHIYSALPARLPGGVLKRDIQKVELPMRVFDQVRAGLDAIKEFLVSSEFKELDAEDKLAAVVTQIKDKKLPLESDNLGQIYSALPARLPGGVLKRDIQTVSLPMRVFDQVRAGLDAIKEFLVSSEFKELDAEDKLAAVVTQIKDKKLPLESDNLGHIYSALPARLPGGVLKRDIQTVSLPMRVFDQVRAGLDAIKEFLVSSEFKELDAEDKLAAVVTQIKDKKLPLESDNLGHIYSALPARLPGGVLKRDIQKVELPMRVFDQVRAGLDAIKEFLVSSEFKELDAEDKLAAVVTQIKDKKLPLESDNLGQIYSALPARLPGGVLKRDIQKVELPMRVFDQVRAGLDAIKEFLVSSEFKELDAEDKLAAVVTQIKDKKLPLESDNLGHIYSALPARLPGGVLKRDIQKVELPMRVFDQVRAGLDAIKEFLVSSEFKELDAEDKLAAVVTQIKDKKLPLESDNLGQIYSALPARLPGGVLKRDIQKVELPMRVFDQVRAGLDAIKEFLVSSEFKELDAEDKLAAVVTQIKDKKLPLESDNLGHIYSALPARLPGGVLKRDIQKVELPMRVFDQVRAGLDAIKEFLVSSEFKELDAEDKLAAVVTQIKDKKLPLESDNLGQIYSALPARLPGGVLKRDIQTVSLPMRVFDQVRAGLDAIKEFLVSSEFKELDAEDKLAAVVTQIKDKKLPLESDNLGQIYSALPARLPGGVLKRDIQTVSLPMRVFDQVRAGLDAIKEFLVSSEFKELDAEDKLAAVVTQIKDKKLPLESDNLGQIYSALPARLPGGVLKRDIQKVELPMRVFDQVRAGLDAIKEFLVSSEFKELDAEDKLAAVVTQIKDKKLPLESDNLGQIYSALPARLPGGVLKRDIQTVSLPMRVFDQVRALFRQDVWERFLREQIAGGLFGLKLAATFAEELEKKEVFKFALPVGGLYTAFPASVKRFEIPIRLRMRVWNMRTESHERVDERTVTDSIFADELQRVVRLIIGEMDESEAKVAKAIIDSESEQQLSAWGYTQAEVEKTRNTMRRKLSEKGYDSPASLSTRDVPIGNGNRASGGMRKGVVVTEALLLLVLAAAAVSLVMYLSMNADALKAGPYFESFLDALRGRFSDLIQAMERAEKLPASWFFLMGGTVALSLETPLGGKKKTTLTKNRVYDGGDHMVNAILQGAPLKLGLKDFGSEAVLVMAIDRPLEAGTMRKLIENLKQVLDSVENLPVVIITTTGLKEQVQSQLGAYANVTIATEALRLTAAGEVVLNMGEIEALLERQSYLGRKLILAKRDDLAVDWQGAENIREALILLFDGQLRIIKTLMKTFEERYRIGQKALSNA